MQGTSRTGGKKIFSPPAPGYVLFGLIRCCINLQQQQAVLLLHRILSTSLRTENGLPVAWYRSYLAADTHLQSARACKQQEASLVFFEKGTFGQRERVTTLLYSLTHQCCRPHPPTPEVYQTNVHKGYMFGMVARVGCACQITPVAGWMT